MKRRDTAEGGPFTFKVNPVTNPEAERHAERMEAFMNAALDQLGPPSPWYEALMREREKPARPIITLPVYSGRSAPPQRRR